MGEVERFLKENPWVRESPDRRERDADGNRVIPTDVTLGEHVPVGPQSKTPAQRELGVLVERVMEYMLPQQRDILQRVFWWGQTQTEIAKDLGVSQQAVSKRLEVAVGQFKVQLAARGLDPKVVDVELEDL